MRRSTWLLVAIAMLALPAGASAAFPSAEMLLEAAQTGEPLTVTLGALGERSIAVWPNPLLAPGARATLRDASGLMHDVAMPRIDTLAGRIVGDDGSVVRLTIARGVVVGGVIATRDGGVSIDEGRVIGAPTEASGVPLRDTVLRPEKDHGSVAVSYYGAANCTLPCGTLTAHVILDSDDTFRSLDPDTCFVRQLETFNNVEGIYTLTDTDISFVVTQQNCWTSNDELGSSSTLPEDYLENVRAAWNGQGADRSTILHAVGFDMPGSTVGIAWLPGVCARFEPTTHVFPSRCSYGQAVYQWVATAGYDASQFLRAKLAAHEIGHNFNAEHDTSGCASGTGSIMCPSLQISGPNTFSATAANAIRDHAESTIGFIACPVGRDGVASSNC